ncbi:MAG: hypothetical protein AAGC68_13365, partial [Verrucomicrobiota bacterium]
MTLPSYLERPMKVRPIANIALISLLTLSASPSSAQDSAGRFGLPTPIADSQFDSLRHQSPFTRILDFSEAIQLTGIAVINGEQVATIRDHRNNESIVISSRPNDKGWKMVGVESSQDLDKVIATIAVNGDELVSVQFDESQLQPNPTEKRAKDKIEIPSGKDRRPLPSDKEKREFGDWVRGRMSKMSEEQRKRVGQIMQEKMKANPDLSDR